MIVVDGGERRRIPPGRPRAILRWLLEHRERIEQRDRIQVTFDCAGERAQAVIKETDYIDTTREIHP